MCNSSGYLLYPRVAFGVTLPCRDNCWLPARSCKEGLSVCTNFLPRVDEHAIGTKLDVRMSIPIAAAYQLQWEYSQLQLEYQLQLD